MEYEYKMVDFKKWCVRCKHKNKPEMDEPCNECLASPVNLHSTKPVKYEKRTRT